MKGHIAGINGLINILKPPGMTSHDVVNYVRRLIGMKKVGHTGTLDPGAAGVLLVCCGSATRIIEYLNHDKEYRAEITFGAFSSTGDAFGEMTQAEIPPGFSKQQVKETLAEFTGEVSQVPPMTSAVRHRGKKLYELARQGEVVERSARTVKIYSIEMTGWYDGPGHPRAFLDVRCSAGTYIRTLCHDIGEKLGCGAYMSFLLRTSAGGYKINRSVTLEELKSLAGSGELSHAAASVEEAMSFLPSVEIKREAVKSVGSGAVLYPPGVRFMPEEVREGNMVVLTGMGGLVAVARAVVDENGRICFKPEKVMI
ncbi:MAG: tRNA pseudouridine(55) synthase TruB [Bacillota bacterium]